MRRIQFFDYTGIGYHYLLGLNVTQWWERQHSECEKQRKLKKIYNMKEKKPTMKKKKQKKAKTMK